MESFRLPAVHVISTSKDELQTTLRGTVALANQSNVRVIILVSSDTGLRERARVQREPLSCLSLLVTS
jgi:hypothetical protein